MFFRIVIFKYERVKFSIFFAQKQVYGLILYSLFTIFSEDRSRLSIDQI